MPAPLFSLTDYCGPNAQGASMQVRLAASPWPTAPIPALSDFVECAFPGYRRALDPMYAGKTVANGLAVLQTNVLQWRLQGPGSFPVAGWFVVAHPIGPWVMVAWEAFPAPIILTPASPGLSLTIQLQALQSIFS